MFKTILVSLASLTALVGVTVASANTDSDWSIQHTYYQDTVNLVNLDGYQIEYWAGECVLRLGNGWARFPDDSLTIRVANAIPTYDLMVYPAKITSCATRG